ncbi:Serine/threonine-protein kinase LATS1-like protein [Dinothrombium tinctorium]|uniref:non-specific serine/threonine protein kinase n=1 Tax=Dinothrombium tinctorium TaxID=1965070 RepID=A0A3S3SGH2_9ACAR|nr:Serine/threonine-protein kinase LATS1-like protein [Dinothrombium tinctorium]
MANLSPAQQRQLSQQLQALNLYTPSANQSASQATYPHSPASLSSLYSSVSSPPPSYAASSSSGRQSPTPTVSSSSEYSSVPPVHLQKLLSSASSTSSTSTSKRTPQTSPCPGAAAATVVSSVIRTSHIQAWGARQAKSQSPVIMQSVKSTQVQKPILQTAIAPTAPQITSVPAAFVTTNASCSPMKITTASQQSLQPSSQSAANSTTTYTGHQTVSAAQPTKVFSPPTSNPPPYPSGNQRLTNCISQSNSCYAQNHGVIPPPPPYASAVQQHLQSITNRSNNYDESVITPHPPPPPPPPYSAALTIIHESDPIKYPVINSRQAGPGNGTVQIPTTDPPSYASSVAALAVQKSVAPASGIIPAVNGCNNKLPNAHQIPGRPPPPLPPNSDLVNTVESICASQVHPPLPSKPCALQPFNDAASVTSATESDCSSNSTSTCNVFPTPISGPRRPAPPPPPSSPPPSLELSSAGNNMEKNETGNYKTTHHSPIPPRKPLSKEKERERRESKVKNYSPAAFKFFMEQHVENIIKSQKEREARRKQLEAEMVKEGLKEDDKKQMRRMLHQKESNYIRLKRAKMDKSIPEDRLGKNGAEEIKSHPFFESIDFNSDLRKEPAPFIPPIRHPTDTSNFDPIDPDKLHNSNKSNGIHPYDDNQNSDRYENGKHPEHAFFEFTFRRFFDDGGQPYPLRMSLDGNEAVNSSSVTDNGQGSPVYV